MPLGSAQLFSCIPMLFMEKKKLPSYSQPSILGPLTSLNPTLPSIASPIQPHLLSFPSYYLPVNTQPSSPVATSLPTSDCSLLQSTYPLFTIQNTSSDIFSSETQPKFNVLPHTTALPSNTHSMQTRSKGGIFQPNLCFKATIYYSFIEPPTYHIASKYFQFSAAMDAEFQTL